MSAGEQNKFCRPIRFDAGEFVVTLQPKGLLIFASKKLDHKHITIHFGGGSGVFDIHETVGLSDGSKKYKTLYAIRREDIPHLFAELAKPLFGVMQKLWHPLRLGWIWHRGIGMVGGIATVGSNLESVPKKKGRYMLMNGGQLPDWAFVPEYLEEIFERPDDAYLLFLPKRKSWRLIGTAVTITDEMGRQNLWWTKRRDMSALERELTPRINQAVQKYLIPPNQHASMIVGHEHDG